jgi:hypothetical protein
MPSTQTHQNLACPACGCAHRQEGCARQPPAKLCCLEKVMRNVVFQFREIPPQGFESAVNRRFEMNLKLCTVDLVTVNLLVIKGLCYGRWFGA